MPRWTGYQKFEEPRRGILYVNGVGYDVLVTRERRGRYEIMLADHYPKTLTLKPNVDSQRVLRVGKVLSVPITAVELR